MPKVTIFNGQRIRVKWYQWFDYHFLNVMGTTNIPKYWDRDPEVFCRSLTTINGRPAAYLLGKRVYGKKYFTAL